MIWKHFLNISRRHAFLLLNRNQKAKTYPPPLRLLAPTSFSSVTSAKVGISIQKFLTFSFNPFATLVKNVKFLPSASPKLLNLNQGHPSKKAVFLVKFF